MVISRIMIVGGPGSGKTWLAGQLGKKLGLPVYDVDTVVWDKGGHLRQASAIDADMLALASRDQWIIEGGNSRTYAERARRAELIVCLIPPVWKRVFRVLGRDGLKLELLYWTIKYDATFGTKDRDLNALSAKKHIEIRSRKDLEKFLREFEIRR